MTFHCFVVLLNVVCLLFDDFDLVVRYLCAPVVKSERHVAETKKVTHRPRAKQSETCNKIVSRASKMDFSDFILGGFDKKITILTSICVRDITFDRFLNIFVFFKKG